MGGAIVGKRPVPGRPAGLDSGGARAYCACGGWGLGVVWMFLLPSVSSLFSSFLADGSI